MGLASLIRMEHNGPDRIEFGSDGNLGGWGYTAWPGVINDSVALPFVGQEQAEGLPGVGRGVELISGVISQLRPQLHENTTQYSQPNITLDTPLLLQNPDPYWHPLPSWLTAMISAMAWHGNGYAYRGVEVSDYRGYPTRLPLIDPCEVSWDGEQYVLNGIRGTREISPPDMFHAPVGVRAGWRLGRGILDRYQSTLKLMAVTEQAQYVLMKDGKPMGILSLGIDVTPEEATEYKNAFLAAAAETGIAAIGNADFKPVQWNSTELSMVPTREFNLRLASDITGVPPYLLGVPSESRVYANMETEWANFIRVTLGRYLSPLAAALSGCFPRNKEVLFNTDQLLRSDAAARWSYYKTGVEIGALTIDEVRDAENLPPLPAAESVEPPLQLEDPDANPDA